MPKKSFIDAIEVKSPCSESWDEMTGNEKVRFCSHCSKGVNNISEMTRKEAMRLVRRSEGRLCVRYEMHPKTHLPVFSTRLSQIARQTGVAAGVLGASLALANGVYAQGEPTRIETVRAEPSEKPGGAVSKISGYVTDPNGAVIPFAVVSITNIATYEYTAANASAEGFYEFKNLAPGNYKLKFEAGGFEMKEIENVQIGEASEIKRDAQLGIQQIGEVVQVGGDEKFNENVGVVGITVGSISYENRNALVAAVMNENIDEVKELISHGAKINVKDKALEGMSPLHAAIETGNFEIMQILLAYGAKPNIRDYQKRTPLMMLDEDADVEMVRVLLAYGANIKLLDAEKNTVLHHFAEIDDAEMMRLLISHGANPNAKNKTGRTALMIAAEHGSSETVRALL
ncbi:MAG: ankyrin repeat domain-containing protein, partial [Pyrinomonadaceae bacterium]